MVVGLYRHMAGQRHEHKSNKDKVGGFRQSAAQGWCMRVAKWVGFKAHGSRLIDRSSKDSYPTPLPSAGRQAVQEPQEPCSNQCVMRNEAMSQLYEGSVGQMVVASVVVGSLFLWSSWCLQPEGTRTGTAAMRWK